jgi:hypothetical protein
LPYTEAAPKALKALGAWGALFAIEFSKLLKFLKGEANLSKSPKRRARKLPVQRLRNKV